jgi:hypothetical protein
MNDQRRPAPKRNRIVDFASCRHAVVDQVQRLTPQRLKQAVGDEPRYFLRTCSGRMPSDS